jgi:hypothetical protein
MRYKEVSGNLASFIVCQCGNEHTTNMSKPIASTSKQEMWGLSSQQFVYDR